MADCPIDFTVAVDASWLREGGIARMANEILARKPANIGVIKMRAQSPNAGLLTPIDLAFKARSVNADAIWSPGFMPPLFRSGKERFCITIHDLTHLHYYSSAHRAYYDLLIRKMISNVDRIFTVSEFTRREISQWSSIDESRVIRIYNGVSSAFCAEGLNQRSEVPYILYVGNRRGYKNIDRLITAFARSDLVGEGFQLWLTGDADAQSAAWAAREQVVSNLRYVGSVSDTALAGLYRGARALTFLSLYEGFGLPVVEAMACGCPVLTSNTTALAEVAADAALTVDPTSIDAITAALNQICFDEPLRTRLRAAGFARAAQFDWDVCADRYWKTLLSG